MQWDTSYKISAQVTGQNTGNIRTRSMVLANIFARTNGHANLFIGMLIELRR